MNPLIAETIGYVGGLCTAFCFIAADAQNYSYKRCAELVSGQLYSLLYRDFILGVIRILRPFGSNGGF